MAYSNWGAFVHKDGVRRTDREDVAVFNDDEKDHPSAARIYVNIMKNRAKYPDGNPPWHERSHHAVLGDGPIRLAGYKNRPDLCELTDDGDVIAVDLTPYRIAAESDEDDETFRGEYKGVKFEASQYDMNMVTLKLTEADGSQWESTCGFEYGAGWMD